jgi:hypothetical protein
MFFAAGDSPQRKLATKEAIQNPMTPGQLRCLADPYNISAECAAVRSAVTLLPFSESHLDNPQAARASAAGATTAQQLVPTPLDLPAPHTPSTAQPFAAALLTHIEAAQDKRHAVPLTTDDQQNLVTMAQRVSAGEANAFDLGLLVWEILEGDLLRPLESKGFVVDFIDTADGPVYTIQWSGANNEHRSWDESSLERRWLELKKVQDAYSRVLPRFNQLLVGMADSTTLLPSSKYLLHLLPFLREKLQFVLGDLTADDFHNYHAMDFSPAQAPLTRNIWLDDLGMNVHGLSMLLHDVWHAILWEVQTPEIKAASLQFYAKIKALLLDPESVKYLDRLIETIVQPPMETKATIAQFIQECRKHMDQIQLYLSHLSQHEDPIKKALLQKLVDQINAILSEPLQSTSPAADLNI